MKLIIAEKPALRDAISEALPGSPTKVDGYFKQGDYIITNVFGHLLTLKEPEDYDEIYAKWSLDTLPVFFPNWGQKIGKDAPPKGNMKFVSKAEKLEQIGKLMEQAECVIHAGDPDDEGQFLIDEIIRWFNYKGKVYRLNTNDTTVPGFKKALASMDDNKLHECAGWAAYARSVADLMVGVNMTRLFSCLNDGATLSVGRVQTPTLGLVVARDNLIESFSKVHFYTVLLEMAIGDSIIPCKYIPNPKDPNLDDGRILDEAYAKKICQSLDGRFYDKQIEIRREMKHESPPLPFNLVKLQTYCGRKFGYTPNQTLEITQNLRDKYKCITYNRTDCQYLTENQYAEAPCTLDAVVKNINYTPPGLDPKRKSKCFSDKNTLGAGEAHTAIVPTAVTVNLASFTIEEKNTYLAICKYYLAQFMPPADKEQTTLLAKHDDGSSVKAVSTKIVNPGYRSIFTEKSKQSESEGNEDGEEECPSLDAMVPGVYSGNAQNAKLEKKETKPPARYTQVSLNEDMTRIAKYVKDEKIKNLLLEKDKEKNGENGSIGTPATRSTIIETLLRRKFIEDDGKYIKSTELGREFYRVLPDSMKKADMTAEWWVIQEDIKVKAATPETLENKVLEEIKDIIAHASDYPKINKNLLESQGSTEKTVVGTCPRCGAPVVEGKKGYGCSAWQSGCKFVLWKKPKASIFEKITISPAQAKKLINGETIETNRLYSARTNKLFSGTLVMDDSEKSEYGATLKMELSAERKIESLGKCPRCGGDVVDSGKSFSCVNYKDGCKFAIWKNSRLPLLANETITAANVKAWLSGKPVLLKKLYSQNHNTYYSAYVELDDKEKSDYGPKLVPNLSIRVPRPTNKK